jgi:hypothetical protein
VPPSAAASRLHLGSASSRSLAEDIRARSDGELRRLVLLRPDLARPAPADLSALAARASTRASVQRALDTLDRGQLQALEAVLVSDEGDRASVAVLLGVTVDEVAPLVERLWAAALVWRGGDALHVVRSASEVLGAVAGLGPGFRELRGSVPYPVDGTPERVDEAALDAAIAAVDEQGRAILDRLAWGPPAGVLPESGAMARAGAALLAAHLLVRGEGRHVVLPREVALRLRGGRLHREPSLQPPAAAASERSMATVDAVAGGQASELLAQVDELVERWGARPPRVLRGGGLSVRDLKQTTTALDLGQDRAAFVIELSHSAGLLADDGSLDPVFAPTPAYDEWQQQPASSRWATLAGAWLTMHRQPSLVGSSGTAGPRGGGTVNALSEGTLWPPGRRRRAEVLDELATLPPGAAPELGSLEERLRWRHPLRMAPGSPTGVDTVLREAEWVGVLGRGALSSAGRALVCDGDDPATVMAAHLPAAVEHVMLQADLTAVAPGRLDGSLNRFMRTAADIESRGGATVFRFSPESLRRVLDAGWSADQVLQTLRAASSTPVPQPLEYLVGDVARRHGRTRVGSVGGYVRSDDVGVLDAMLADRGLSPLQLRRIAPTVLVSPAPAATVMDLLRDNGFSPAVETPEGGLLVAAPSRHRAPARRAAPPVRTTTVDEAYAESLVTGLRAGEEAAAYRREQERNRPGPSLPSTDPAVTLALLRDAAADRQGVWIGHADPTGRTRRMLFYPTRIEGGRAHGQVEGETGERSFSVHRITGVAPD